MMIGIGLGLCQPRAGASAPAPEPGLSLFANQTPAGGELVTGDPDGYQLGTRFVFSAGGTVTGLRFYRAAGQTGYRTLYLWRQIDSTALAIVDVPEGDGSAGWKEVVIPPVSIVPGLSYIVAVTKPAGATYYYSRQNFFTSDKTDGPITSPAGGNGLYSPNIDWMPAAAFNSSYYFTDVVFKPSAMMVSTSAPNYFNVAVADGQLGDAYPGLSAELTAIAGLGAKMVRTDFRQSVLGTTYVPPTITVNPGQSISSAIAGASAGAIVLVKAGSYSESVTIGGSGGTSGSPITLRAEPGTVIHAAGWGGITITAPYIVVDGFEVVGAQGPGIWINGAHHTTIRNCKARDCGESGISSTFADHVTIEDCTCHNNAASGWFSGISLFQNREAGGSHSGSFRNIVRRNICYANLTATGAHTDGNGIIIDYFQGTQEGGWPDYDFPTLVEGNLCYGNGGKGIQVTWSDSVTVRKNTCTANNIDTLNDGTWRGEISISTSKGGVVEDNIAVAVRGSGYLTANRAYDDTSTSTGYNSTTWAGNIGWDASGTPSVRLGGSNQTPPSPSGIAWLDPLLSAKYIPAAGGAASAGWRPVTIASDALMDAAPAAGLGVVGILNPNTDLGDSTKRAGYAAYCGRIAARYAGKMAAWTICNEPNMSGSTKVLMADYCPAYELAYAAIRAVDPNVLIGAGALAGIETMSGDFQGTVAFVTAIYDNCPSFVANPGKAFIDLHSYTDSATYNWNHANKTSDWHTYKIIQNVKALMASKGDPHRRIWITETGMHTHGAGFTEEWQARWLREQCADLLNDPRIENIFWYSSVNQQAEASEQDKYGLWLANGSPKKIAHDFRARATLFASASPSFEVDKGADRTIPLFRWFRDATSAAGANLTFSLIGAPAGVTINGATGIVTVADATAVAQASAPITCRATHTNGSEVELVFNLAINHPNLLPNGDFAASGNVTGWNPASGNATVAYDAGQGSLLCNITGAGGGWLLSAGVTVVNGAVYQRGILAKKATYAGSLLNTTVAGNATTPATITPGADYTWNWVEYTSAGTSATVGAARNGSSTGTMHVIKEVLRRKV